MRVQGSVFGIHGTAVCAALGLAVLLAGCGPATPKQEFEAGLALLKKGDVAAGKARLEAALERAPERARIAEAQLPEAVR